MAAINAAQHAAGPSPVPVRPPPAYERRNTAQQNTGGAVPIPPGMMDIEMETPYQMPAPTPWASAFRAPNTPIAALQGVPPSLLSFTPPPAESARGNVLTSEQLQAKALRKAQRKAEKAAAREEASASDNEGEKRFACPIEGCGKVYKQANGLKYHLTRSINSGHGNVAAMGGLVGFTGDKSMDFTEE